MPLLYVMRVPEFEPLAEAARAGGAEVREAGDYFEVTSAGPSLVIERAAHSPIRPAIWFAALAGGYLGRVARFDGTRLEIEDDR
jgi:hypothetical protein